MDNKGSFVPVILFFCGVAFTAACSSRESTTEPPPPQGFNWLVVSAGQAHSCGARDDGAVLCWGEGGSGRLGTGNTADQLQPVRASSSRSLVQTSAGAEHSCAVANDGAALCWGKGE